VIALDTNVLARFLLDDTPAQMKAATNLLHGAERCTAPITVMLELAWVLESLSWQREDISRAIRLICSLENFTVQHFDAIIATLYWYENGMGFADGLHLALSINSSGMKSFDKSFIKTSRRLKTMPPVSRP